VSLEYDSGNACSTGTSFMDGKKIIAKLKKIELNSFLLNNRGFHWISEFPFNR